MKRSWLFVTLYEMSELSKKSSQARLDKWYTDLTIWQFYFCILCLVLPWLIWLYYARRHNPPRGVYFFGALAALLSSFIDQAGVFFSLYVYPVRVFPFLDTFSPAFIAVVPTVFMFIYTYFRTWKQYLAGLVLAAILLSFVAEPITVWMGLYILIKWTYYDSALAYLFIGVVAKTATDRLYPIK